MVRELHINGSPLSEDTGAGDDGDLPGRALPMSVDDVDEIMESPDLSTEQRRGVLGAALADLDERQSMDRIDSHDAIRARIADALAQLDGVGDGDGGPEAYGFDPETRLDQPDEILERAEDEGEDL